MPCSVIDSLPIVDPLQLQFYDTLSISDVSSFGSDSFGSNSSGLSSVVSDDDDILVDGLDNGNEMIPGVVNDCAPGDQSPIIDVDMSTVMSDDSVIYVPPNVECIS